jgi:hypothetical protein
LADVRQQWALMGASCLLVEAEHSMWSTALGMSKPMEQSALLLVPHFVVSIA